MCTRAASGQRSVCSDSRTVVGTWTGIFSGTDPQSDRAWKPLAFPGSMCGALLGGLLYRYGKKLPFAYIGEVFGTGIIGGMLSYPVASLIMGNQSAALFTFVVPFLVSTCGGTVLAAVITISMAKMGVLAKLQNGEV